MRYLVLLLAPFVLAACATLSEDQCRAGDWHTIGRADGADGRRSDFIVQHAKACNKIGIAPVRAEWEEGRQEGLLLYCRPRRAYDEGARGRRLSPVCPLEDLSRLERANDRGLRWYRIGQDISEAQRDINEINARLSQLAPDDPERFHLISLRSSLRLDIVTLRAQRNHYRY
ncbi:MAG: DUF2799 domain-containing protein [Silicimonas sp.]|nr:DUF2799 domain-containing protein [Silicimonas sp.]